MPEIVQQSQSTPSRHSTLNISDSLEPPAQVIVQHSQSIPSSPPALDNFDSVEPRVAGSSKFDWSVFEQPAVKEPSSSKKVKKVKKEKKAPAQEAVV